MGQEEERLLKISSKLSSLGCAVSAPAHLTYRGAGLGWRMEGDLLTEVLRAAGLSMPGSGTVRGRDPSSWIQALRQGSGRKSPPRVLPAAWTDLLGSKLLVSDSGTQQGLEGSEELPPRPVLDRQERSHILLDALCGQPANLEGKNRNVRCPPNPGEGKAGWEEDGGSRFGAHISHKYTRGIS